MLGLDVRFWHDNGAYTPYGIIVPIITSTQLLGPYKPGAYRVEFYSLYTNTVIVTPYRGAGRPQGVLRDGAHHGRDRRRRSGSTAPRSARRNFIQPDELPYDHGLIFQDGRPLIYDSGDYPASLKAQGRWSAGTTSPARERRGPQGRRVGIGLACYVEGTGVGPYEGAHVGRDHRQGQGRDRADHAGAGPRRRSSRRSRRRARRAARATSRSSPATPGGSATPSARSPRGPR